MSYQECIQKKKEIYEKILLLIENETNEDDIGMSSTLNDFLPDDEILRKTRMKEILCMISKITNNHQRNQYFYEKVKQIFFILKDHIKLLNDLEIFNIFRNNKRMILFLFENEIIKINSSNKKIIINYFKTKKDVQIKFNEKTIKTKKKTKTKTTKTNSNSNKSSLILFFYPEIKEFVGEEKQKQIEKKLMKILQNESVSETFLDDFYTKRKIGENDDIICSLIRSDSVDEFIAYVSRTNLSLRTKIKPSIYETNSFLIKNEPTLIEYAAFFGSIRIFKYLKIKEVPLTSSLWRYTIHSKNAELIQFLEENNVIPEKNKKTRKERFEDVFIESIKCHHNDIAEYIKTNLFKKNNDLNENITSYIFQYYNYYYFPDEINGNDFYYLCKFDYLEIVNILQKEGKIDKKDIISTKSISKSVF